MSLNERIEQLQKKYKQDIDTYFKAKINNFEQEYRIIEKELDNIINKEIENIEKVKQEIFKEIDKELILKTKSREEKYENQIERIRIF